MPDISEPVVLVLIGALLNLDKQALGPFLAGRPLVVGLILGLAAGEPVFGIWLGLSAELLWVAALPLGGEMTPHAGLAVSGAFIAWKISGFAPASAWPPSEMIRATLVVAFLTIPPWAKAMSLIDILGRRLASSLPARIQADLARGREPRFFTRNLYGLAVTLALSAAFLALAAAVNSLVIRLAVGLAPQAALFHLSFIFSLVPFIGLLGLAVFMEAKSFTFYLGGLLAGLLAFCAV